MVTCCDDAYWPTMERFLNNYNIQNQDFKNLILYNLGLNGNNLKKLNESLSDIYNCDWSKYGFYNFLNEDDLETNY